MSEQRKVKLLQKQFTHSLQGQSRERQPARIFSSIPLEEASLELATQLALLQTVLKLTTMV